MGGERERPGACASTRRAQQVHIDLHVVEPHPGVSARYPCCQPGLAGVGYVPLPGLRDFMLPISVRTMNAVTGVLESWH